jgi:3-oxoacyl-[acyl-carrier-protein] synthase III
LTTFARLAGVGSYLPPLRVTNDDLIRRGVETSDEWIASRTGIRARHYVEGQQCTSDLAYEASVRALEMAGIDAKDIDLIVVATSTPDFVFPSSACFLQAKLGNRGAIAFDVQAVCAGFVYALAIAEKFIRSGTNKKALVVGAEVFSRIMDWTDRGTCVLFGDGAGAVVLESSDREGILSSVLHADGTYADILHVKGQISAGTITGDPFLRMDGQAVFKFAVKALSEAAEEVCKAAGLTYKDVDWLVPHQANIRIIESTAKKMQLPMDKVIVTVDQHGNTSAASVPLALDAGIRSGRIKRGDVLLLEAVGGGFTWGAIALRY